MKNITITGRALISLNGNPLVDFRPFFQGREHGEGCSNCNWEIRGVIKCEENEFGKYLTVFTGGCCEGFLIEAIAHHDGKVSMGTLLRLERAPQTIIPIFFFQEGGEKVYTETTYLVVKPGFDGNAEDPYYDSVSLISLYHNRGAEVELIRVPSKSLTDSRLSAKKNPGEVLALYPQLLDLVEELKIRKRKVAKEATVAWANNRENVVDTYWCRLDR